MRRIIIMTILQKPDVKTTLNHSHTPEPGARCLSPERDILSSLCRGEHLNAQVLFAISKKRDKFILERAFYTCDLVAECQCVDICGRWQIGRLRFCRSSGVILPPSSMARWYQPQPFPTISLRLYISHNSRCSAYIQVTMESVGQADQNYTRLEQKNIQTETRNCHWGFAQKPCISKEHLSLAHK